MSPGKRKAKECTGPDAITEPDQSPPMVVRDGDDDPGFFARAAMGKVRPAAREPNITHYGCACCGWSA